MGLNGIFGDKKNWLSLSLKVTDDLENNWKFEPQAILDPIL